jgi:excinuclease ABC subunit C
MMGGKRTADRGEGRKMKTAKGDAAGTVPAGDVAAAAVDLLDKAARLPDRPGVYIFRDAAGDVIYVGKARSLPARVRSYFGSPRGLDAKTLAMRERIHDLEFIVTDGEIEALMLESNLIKRYRPQYNIRLADDKQYPYLRVDVGAAWPRVTVVRAARRDEARYFGPYSSAGAMRETLNLTRQLFPLRTCNDARLRRRGRPCLYHHIGRCLGPCTGEADLGEYGEAVRGLCLFLEGRQREVLRDLKRLMEDAASRTEFERAAALRDRVRAVERVMERQKAVSADLGDRDAIGLARADAGAAGAVGAAAEGAATAGAAMAGAAMAGAATAGEACGVIFAVRDGKLIGQERQFLVDPAATEAELLGALLQHHYASSTSIPREILLPAAPQDAELLESWLHELRGGPVHLAVPRRGEKRKLVSMAAENAALLLREREAQKAGGAAAADAMLQLQRDLDLAHLPRRIEGYDISNIQGREAVGAMVVFEEGRPRRDHYRRFRIRTVTGPDDFAMLGEVLGRRLRRLTEAGEGAAEQDAVEGAADAAPARFGTPPDLILVDGGRGQLGVAERALAAMGLDIPVVALAKAEEQVFAPGRPEPLPLDRRSPALMLLERVRDEAHRFAVTYHRATRGRTATRSRLDGIEGIGPRRRAALLRRFGSPAGIAAASADEITAVPGMNAALAAHVKEALAGLAGGGTSNDDS